MLGGGQICSLTFHAPNLSCQHPNHRMSYLPHPARVRRSAWQSIQNVRQLPLVGSTFELLHQLQVQLVNTTAYEMCWKKCWGAGNWTYKVFEPWMMESSTFLLLLLRLQMINNKLVVMHVIKTVNKIIQNNNYDGNITKIKSQ